MLLEGIFPPITTPFYPDGSLYLRKLEHNVARYSRTQLAGMVVLGSTGEAVMLSDEEQREVLRAAIGAATQDKVMIAGVGHESVRQTVGLAEYAARLHYDAVLVRTPHFYRAQLHRRDREPLEMLTFYRAVADRSALPVILYSVPAFTQYDLPVEVVAELAQHPNIIGIKDSSGDAKRVAAIVQATQAVRRSVTVTTTFAAVPRRMLLEQEAMVTAAALANGSATIAVADRTPAKTRQKEVGFAVLSGGASTLQACFDAGAVGGILAFATCAPQCCYEVWAAFRDGDAKLTSDKQQKIQAASTSVGSRMGIPALKYACDLNGYFGGIPRLPLLPLTADEQQQVREQMADIRY